MTEATEVARFNCIVVPHDGFKLMSDLRLVFNYKGETTEYQLTPETAADLIKTIEYEEVPPEVIQAPNSTYYLDISCSEADELSITLYDDDVDIEQDLLADVVLAADEASRLAFELRHINKRDNDDG